MDFEAALEELIDKAIAAQTPRDQIIAALEAKAELMKDEDGREDGKTGD